MSEKNNLSANKFKPITEVTRELLTTEEAAFYLGMKAQTLRKWQCEGQSIIHPVFVGRTPRYKKTDVQQIISGHGPFYKTPAPIRPDKLANINKIKQ